ncbi:MAG: hypothetical protein IE891_09270 [Flavobacteriaceae bacterium]|nr:hypothetical protein [Flavobacteriaceae bacterium]
MNKITGFILSFFILISNLGLAVNIHYCHDKVASVSLNYSTPSEDDSDCCCIKKDVKKKCCSETTLKTEKKSDNFVVKSISLDFEQFVAVEQFNFNFKEQIFSIESQKLIENYSESNSPPLYKLYCQLVFYA